MLGVIFSVLMLFLAIVGLIEIFRIILFSFFRTKHCKDLMIIMPLSGNDKDVELLLRNAASRIKWVSGSDGSRVICVDMGMDAEARQICDIMSCEYKFIETYSIDEFRSHFDEIVDIKCRDV